MKVLTWNIQATRGCDTRFDLPRIATHIKGFGDVDVICLQEVSRFIPDLNNNDQLSLLAQQFADHTPVWAPGFSVTGQPGLPSEFGNLTLVRSGLLRNSRSHMLPSPAVQDLQLSRTMVETVVTFGDCALTIFNAHLAFHSSIERVQQIEALTRLRDQIMDKSQTANTLKGVGPYQYADASHAVILCGDLNVSSDTDEFKTHISDQRWIDCWDAQFTTGESQQSIRQPTCGCFDHIQWPEGAHVRDYFLATDNLSCNVVNVEVDVATDASDHQPVLLNLCV